MIDSEDDIIPRLPHHGFQQHTRVSTSIHHNKGLFRKVSTPKQSFHPLNPYNFLQPSRAQRRLPHRSSHHLSSHPHSPLFSAQTNPIRRSVRHGSRQEHPVLRLSEPAPRGGMFNLLLAVLPHHIVHSVMQGPGQGPHRLHCLSERWLRLALFISLAPPLVPHQFVQVLDNLVLGRDHSPTAPRLVGIRRLFRLDLPSSRSQNIPLSIPINGQVGWLTP